MFGKPTLTSSLRQLGDQLLDNAALKAVMISKDDAGDIVITLVEGIDESHKVKFGRIDRRYAPSHLTLPRTSAGIGRLTSSFAHLDPGRHALLNAAAA